MCAGALRPPCKQNDPRVGAVAGSAIYIAEPELAKGVPNLYKLTHKNHPDAVWVRSSINHYLYLLDLMDALNDEANYRYGGSKIHLSLSKAKSWPFPALPDIAFVDQPKCVHDDFKGIADTVAAYREYYKRDKREIATWTKRPRRLGLLNKFKLDLSNKILYNRILFRRKE